jgi:hypothetical protein
MSNHKFVYDERLGIHLPELRLPFEEYELQERTEIVTSWEQIRGHIPSRVMELEKVIELKLERLGEEENFENLCQLNGEISELASTINDLHIWYRVTADIPLAKPHL